MVARLLSPPVFVVVLAAALVGPRCAFADDKYTIKFVEVTPVGGGKSRIQFKEKSVGLDDLLKELKSDDRDVRLQALRAIYWPDKWPQKDAKALLKGLGERLKDKDDAIRFHAAQVLAYSGPQCVAVLPALMEAATDKDDLTRSRVLGAIAQIGPKAKPAIAVLVRALGDASPPIAGIASDALGNIGAEAVPDLIVALKSEKVQVREEAAHALAMIGPDAKKAVPALKELYRDEKRSVVRAASMAVGEIEETPNRPKVVFPGKIKPAKAEKK